MNLEFKKYDDSYLEGCAIELCNSFKEEPWNETWTLNQAKQRIIELSKSYGFIGIVLIDKDTNEVVSFMAGRIMTYLNYKEYWIDDLSVNPKYKGHGIGTKMIQYAKSYIPSINKDVIRFSLYTVRTYSCYDFYIKNKFINDKKFCYLYLDL